MSMAAFGDPAVPLVNISAARSASARSTSGPAVPAATVSKSIAFAIAALVGAITVMSGCSSSWPESVDAPVGPTMSMLGRTAAISRSSSAVGLCGFNGTTTAPAPSTAK